jgi:hypothetical protein
MMRGRWRESVADAAGGPPRRTPWRSNTIVDACWPLLAGLLKGEEALGGIRFWAVGAGDPAWDRAPPASDPHATRLRDEVARVRVEPGDMAFLDAGGRAARGRTARLEVRARFALKEDATLREFGIVGGDATERAGSGQMLNYVVHPRLELAAGTRLERRLRFSFDGQPRTGGAGAVDAAAHWLGGQAVAVVEGVGRVTAESLGKAGITTVEELAAAEPLELEGVASLATRVQLRARARLLLRIAGEIRPPEGFFPRTAWDVLVTPTATLAAEAEAGELEAALLREQVSALELALDSRFLRGITVGELARPRGGLLSDREAVRDAPAGRDRAPGPPFPRDRERGTRGGGVR